MPKEVTQPLDQVKKYGKQRARLILVFMGLSILLLIIAAASSLNKYLPKTLLTSQPGLYRITEFVDGDTIAVDMNGTVEKVRFIGVDTPETHRPNTPVQCYGEEAAAYTRQLIGNNRIRLAADPLDTDRDRYGRLLRYVFLPDGTLVNKEIIAQGYGFAYTLFPFSKKAEFKAAENEAEASGQGLWNECQVTQDSGAKHTQPVK